MVPGNSTNFVPTVGFLSCFCSFLVLFFLHFPSLFEEHLWVISHQSWVLCCVFSDGKNKTPYSINRQESTTRASVKRASQIAAIHRTQLRYLQYREELWVRTGTRATTEVDNFRWFFSWMTGFLNPKSSDRQSCFEKWLSVYLGHEIFHRDAIRSFAEKSVFGWGKERSFKWGASEKIGWTPIDHFPAHGEVKVVQ